MIAGLSLYQRILSGTEISPHGFGRGGEAWSVVINLIYRNYEI